MKTYIIIFLSIVGFGTTQAQTVVDRIVGQVGGEIILLSEIQEIIAYQESSQGVVSAEQKCEIARNIISDKLLINQAILDSVEVTDVEIDNQLNARIDQILNYMNNDVTQFENYYGKTISEVKKEMRQDLKNRLLSDRMKMQIVSSVEATPEEVIKFFKNIPEDSIPYYNSEVELQELVIQPEITEKQKIEAISTLNDIKAKIESGEESFEDMAVKYSDDPGSKRRGGMIGMMKRGALAQGYEAAAYHLEIDQISEPVETEFGFHIIQLLERRGNNFSTRHILIKPEIEQESIDKANSYLDSLRGIILSDSASFEAMVVKHGYENIPSYSYGGRIINNASGDSYFEIGDIDPDIYFAIDTMDVGGITKPMQYKNQRGDLFVRIVRLVSLSDPHKASLEKDFARIQQLATEKKKYKVLEDWMTETARNTYIELEFPEGFSQCSTIHKWKNN